MPYQPGPFRLLPASAIQVQQDDYGFGQFVTDEWPPIDSLTADIDQALATIGDWTAGIEAPPPGFDPSNPLAVIAWLNSIGDPTPGIDLDGALAGVGIVESMPVFDDEPSLLLASETADTYLTLMFAAAPSEAFTPPPAPFAPPSPTIDVPTIPPTAFAPASAGVVGQPAPGSGTTGRTLVLLNQTVYGSPNFRVTDTWLVQATGNPGDGVSAHAFVNGNDIGSVSLGAIGSDGRFEQSGNFSPGDEGAWREDWSVGGQQVVTYNFLVTPTQ